MMGTTASLLATLAVLYSLIVLLIAERNPPAGPALITGRERLSDASLGLIQTLQRRQRQSNVDRIMQIQQALKDDGFYSGPVDGVLRESTREAIQSFQRSNHLAVTGSVDDEIAQELGVQ